VKLGNHNPCEQEVILLAEDDENDIALLRLALRRSSMSNFLHVVRDGEECIAYLEGVGKYANRTEYPLPALLLLDLNMPRTDGFEVLRWIRENPYLNRLRVVVLTTSDHIYDVNRAYDLGANSFLVKTRQLEDFIAQIDAIQSYWLSFSRAPEVIRSPQRERSKTK
jgi:CheY-like chemotaxis protein